jgi:CRISPR-associated protein Cmr1
MKITIETLTPLWTGGIDNAADQIHATGIIGSLRWWYRIIVTGMGKNVSELKACPCQYDAEAHKKALQEGLSRENALAKAGLCSVCQIFGATGWSRRFRFVLSDHTDSVGSRQVVVPSEKRLNKNNEKPKYFFPPGREGDFELNVIPTVPDFQPQLILGILKLLENNAGLSSKTQLGYGLFRITNAPSFDITEFLRYAQTALVAKTSPETPNFRQMFFAEYEFANAQGLQSLVDFKFDLRRAFRNGPAKLLETYRPQLRHFVCGTIRGQSQAAKVYLAQGSNNNVRVWGWVPEKLPVTGVTRDEVVSLIQSTLSSFGKQIRWREFDSSRDLSKCSDSVLFLTNLIEGK